MVGYIIHVQNSDGKTLVTIQQRVSERVSVLDSLENMEKDGKSKCILDNGGYPYRYSVKASDIIPVIEKWFDSLRENDPRLKMDFWMMGYGVTPDCPVHTTKNKSEIPVCSPDETLTVELWDLS